MATVDVTMYQRNNKWTVIADATAGTTALDNNNIIVDISATEYRFNPLSSIPNGNGYLLKHRNGVYYLRITT